MNQPRYKVVCDTSANGGRGWDYQVHDTSAPQWERSIVSAKLDKGLAEAIAAALNSGAIAR